MSYHIQTQTRQAQPTLVVSATLTVDELGPWLARSYESVMHAATEQGAALAGPPFARYHRVGPDRFAVEAGFPVSPAAGGDGEAHPSELPGGPVATTVHVGPYAEMEPAYEALASWVEEHHGEFAGDPWETYLSDPSADPDPSTWRTEVTQPYRPAAD